MKNRLFLFCLLAALAVSCMKDQQEVIQMVTDDQEFFATIEETGEPDTRVYANDQLRVRWDAGDHISIFNKTTYNREYAFQGETGDNSGSFKKVPNDDFFTGNDLDYIYAVYPYQESTKISDDGELTFILPAEQFYRENSFGLGANTMISVTEDNELHFKNLCGYLLLKLYGEGVSVSSITLKGNNGERLAGKATVTIPLNGAPNVTMASDATTEITLCCETPVQLGATAEESTQFWFVIPPMTFEKGFTVTVKDNMNCSFEKSTTKSFEIGRNKLARMSPLKVELSPSTLDPNDFSSQYLTFEILSDGLISWVSEYNGYTIPKTIEYSQNGGAWMKITSTTDGTSISVKKGDLLRFRGDNESYGALNVINSQNRPFYNYFQSFCQFKVYGNIMSLINSTNFKDLTTLTESCAFFSLFKGCNYLIDASHLVLPALTLTERCYWNMFMGCTNLVSTPELPATTLADYCYSGMFSSCKSLQTTPNLPATALASHCYERMFYGCSNLVTVSDLPATTLSDNCYSTMFYGCTSLLYTPSLPATNLAEYCYYCMFQDCTNLKTSVNLPATTLAAYCYFQMYLNCSSLTSAPELPAKVLVDYCYNNMFLGCTSLEYIKCLATDISASNCTSSWVYNVSSSGVFVKDNSMNAWPSGSNGIPKGWTVKTSNAENIEMVDLGLSVKWANMNLGATKPEEYGDYFAWGETEPHYNSLDPLSWKPGKENGYTWSTYEWCNGSQNSLTKYNTKDSFGVVDNKTTLDPEDDAARVNLGENWRMPTLSEVRELFDNCTFRWTTINGVKGSLFTSNKEGYTNKSIFFPATGRFDGASLYKVSSFGYFWSSSLHYFSDPMYESYYYPYDAYYYSFNSGTGVWGSGDDSSYRYYGYTIRPVFDDRIHPISITLNKTSLSLFVGRSEQLIATISPADATDKMVSWSSDNTDVVTVDSNGYVTAVSAGLATITATTNDGNLTATCAITVNPVLTPVEYVLVKDVAELTVGSKVIIAAAAFDKAISTTQNTNNRPETAVVKEGDKIVDSGSSVEIFTVEEGTTAGTFAFKASGTEGYIYAVASKNNLKTAAAKSEEGDWTVTIADNSTVIGNTKTSRFIRYNAGSGLFSSYASTSSIKDSVAIYKLADTPTPPEKQFTLERVWGLYTTADDLWCKDVNVGGTSILHPDGYGMVRSIAMDDDYIYLPKSSAYAAVLAIKRDDPTQIIKLNVNGMKGTLFASSFVRIIKNTDPTVNGGKDILLVCNVTSTDSDENQLRLFAYKDGIQAAPTQIAGFNWDSVNNTNDWRHRSATPMLLAESRSDSQRVACN